MDRIWISVVEIFMDPDRIWIVCTLQWIQIPVADP